MSQPQNKLANLDVLCDGFVNLPIIISDYDAICVNSPVRNTFSNTSETGTNTTEAISTSSGSASACSAPSFAEAQRWTTGFAEFADQLFSRMTNGAKQKLREACVEVLKRTEDPREDERVTWVYDEDARLLD